MEQGHPILLVAHEADDGSWQFIGRKWQPNDLVVICLSHAYSHDPTVGELADLPLGWGANRAAVSEPWRCYPLPPETEESG